MTFRNQQKIVPLCCTGTENEIYLNDKNTFNQHYRKIHFGRKRQHHFTKCVLCLTNLNHVDSVARHFKSLHKEEAKFLFEDGECIQPEGVPVFVPEDQMIMDSISSFLPSRPSSPNYSMDYELTTGSQSTVAVINLNNHNQVP